MAGTDKQRAARDRNWRIFQLRGLYYNWRGLDPDLNDQLKQLVDEQLARLGAESETDRYLNRRLEWEKEPTA